MVLHIDIHTVEVDVYMKVSLNKDQKSAVDCLDKHILCLAGPGAGKTFTMIERITQLIHEGVDPSDFLVLTFTHAAAFEMEQRFRKKNPGIKAPDFKTFHAFCYALLARDKAILKKLGYSSLPDIVQEQEERKLGQEIADQLGIKMNVRGTSLPIFTPKMAADYAILVKAIDRRLKQENKITFDRLCYDICSLFENDDPLTKKYKERYRFIFVDEFQDTDPKQWRFVKSFKEASIFLVADALQAIYGFRGADSSIVKKIAESKEYTVIKLHQNYRSTQEICKYINSFSTYADDSYRILVNSSRPGPKVHVEFLDESNGAYVSEEAMEKALQNVNDHKDEGTVAVLTRTNRDSYEIQKYLESHGVDVITGRRNDQAINVLNSLFDDKYLYEWLTSLLSSQMYVRYLHLSNISEFYELNDFLKDFRDVYAVSSAMKMVKDVRTAIAGAKYGKSSQEIIDEIRGILHIRRRIDLKSLHVRNDMSAEDIQMTMLLNLDIEQPGSVYVGTIHSSKGLEYETVIVLGAGTKSFQLSYEDNKNLYYVAISRAKTNLYVYKENWVNNAW